MMRSGEGINAVVIGAGHSGARFAHALTNQGNLTAIYDIDPQKALVVARNSGNLAYRTNDLEDAVWKAQAVYICTPPEVHFEQILQSVGEDRVVFCEKPAVTDIRQAFLLQDLLNKSGSKFLVGNYHRLNGSIQRTLQMVRSGGIGELVAMRASYMHDMTQYNQESPWRAEPGMFLYDGGSHPVDLVCEIAGRPIRRVNANKGQGEQYNINVIFEGGVLANVWVDATAQVPVHGTEIEVFGSKGIVRAHNQLPYFELSLGGNRFTRVSVFQPMLPIDHVVAVINAGIRTGRGDFSLLPGINKAVQTVSVLEAAERSAKNLGSPIVLRL